MCFYRYCLVDMLFCSFLAQYLGMGYPRFPNQGVCGNLNRLAENPVGIPLGIARRTPHYPITSTVYINSILLWLLEISTLYSLSFATPVFLFWLFLVVLAYPEYLHSYRKTTCEPVVCSTIVLLLCRIAIYKSTYCISLPRAQDGLHSAGKLPGNAW